MDIGQRGHLALLTAHDFVLTLGQAARRDEGVAVVEVGRETDTTVKVGHIEIAPVDAYAVALLGEDRLFDGAGLQIVHAAVDDGRRDGGLRHFVHGHVGCSREV